MESCSREMSLKIFWHKTEQIQLPGERWPLGSASCHVAQEKLGVLEKLAGGTLLQNCPNQGARGNCPSLGTAGHRALEEAGTGEAWVLQKPGPGETMHKLTKRAHQNQEAQFRFSSLPYLNTTLHWQLHGQLTKKRYLKGQIYFTRAVKRSKFGA